MKIVFKPFVFNPIAKQTIKVNKYTELSIPKDYIKDIDKDKLEMSFNHEDLNWIEFDQEKTVLSMTQNQIGEFELIFTAINKYKNITEDKVKFIVEE